MSEKQPGEKKHRLGGVGRCVLAILLTLAAGFLDLKLAESLGGQAIYLTFFPVLLLTAFYGGVLPGVLVTALSLAFLVVGPLQGFWNRPQIDLVALGFYGLSGTFISVAIHLVRHAHSKLRSQEQELKRLLEQRNAELSDVSSHLKAESDERAAAQRALARSEALYRGTFENAAMGMVHSDLEGHWVQVNEAMCRMTGYSREELLALSSQGLTDPRDLGKSVQKIPLLLTGEMSAYSVEKRYRHRDGSTVWVNATVSLLRDEAREPVMLISMVDNITARVEAEEALRLNQRQMSFFFEFAPAAVAVFDKHMHYLQASRRWITDFQLEKQSVLGRSHYEIFPEMPERWRQIHERCLAGVSERCDEDLFERADGSRMWLNWEILPWLENDGTVGGLIIASTDITTRKEAEEALRRSDELARAQWAQAEATLEAVPAQILVLGEQGEILRANQAWNAYAQSQGFAEQAVGLGSNYMRFLESVDHTRNEDSLHFAQGIREVLSGGRHRFSMEYLSADGSRWWVGHVVSALSPGPARALVAYVDITEQKLAQKEVELLNEQLEKRVQERTWQLESAVTELQEQISERQRLEDEVLSISGREQSRLGQELHDDLGQQLAGIRILAQLLHKNLDDEGHPGATDCAQIANFVGEALDTTRSLSKSFYPVELERGGLALTLKDLAERTQAQTKVQCTASFDENFQAGKEAAIHLYRIVQESVSNALRHGNPTEIRIEGRARGTEMTLSIVDDGIGFHEKPKGSGGLGLRLFQYRARLIGATLTVGRVHEGGGCRVRCVFQQNELSNHW